jgi:hypothetical protein
MSLEGSPVRRLSGIAPDSIPFDALIEAQQPVVMEGLAGDWPLVACGRKGPAAAAHYLKRFAGDRPVTAFTGPPEIGGRFHYNADLSGLNFTANRVPLAQFLDTILAHLGDPAPPSFYAGSTDLDIYLPGFREENDLARYPRFGEARAAAQVAELEPGDVLFYPALWWHQVEALDAFNAMVNYWWNPVPAWIDTPHTTLLHALLSLRDRPDSEKRAWRALFEYYVFGPADRAAAHLPGHAQGPLGPMDEMAARKLRAQVLNRLNR